MARNGSEPELAASSTKIMSDRGVDYLGSSRDQPGEILLAGHFDPAMIAPLLSREGAAQLAGLSGPPGVPIHHLAGGLANRGIKTTVLGGLSGAPEIYVRDELVSAALYHVRSTRAFTLTGFRRERTAILEHLRPNPPGYCPRSLDHGSCQSGCGLGRPENSDRA